MQTLIYFGECSLDPERRVLTSSGKPVPIEPRVLDLLLTLIRNRERVVTRTEILENLWSGRSVGRSALNACMSRLRAAIGDSDGKEMLVRAFPRYGYRFVGELRELPSARRTDTPLGRARELEILSSLLDDALHGNGSVVHLRGAAGIGKSTILDRIVWHARARGIEVRRGFCDEAGAPPALWPWLQVATESSLSNTTGGPWALQVDALCTVILRQAEMHALFIAIEDVQWADSDSMTVLRHLARRAATRHLLIVVTQRTNPASPSRPLSQAQIPRLFDLELLGLDAPSVGELAKQITAVDLDGNRRNALFNETAGNPLFVRELAPVATASPGPWRVPTILDDILESFLHGLDPSVRKMLIIGACAGESFTSRFLQPRLIAEAEHRQLIEAVDDEKYVFRLPLLRSYLAGKVSPVQRRLFSNFWRNQLATNR